MTSNSPPVFMWGGPGIGKSAIVKQIAEERDIGFLDFRLAQVDPVDLRGPLMQTEDGEMRWLTPSAFPDDGEGILFLDELNLAPTSIQNAAYQLVFKKKIGEYELPEGWNVIAAGNKEEHAQVHSMQPPLRNRFFHIEVEPNSEDWREWALDTDIEKTWAEDNKINSMVLAYLANKPGDLYKFSSDRDRMNFPSPRTWEMASYLLDSGAPYSDLKGALGEQVASEFIGFLRTADDMPNLNRIIEGEDIIPDRPDILYAVATGIVNKVKEEPEHLGRLWEYAVELGEQHKDGTEFAVLIGRDAMRAGLNPSKHDFNEEAYEKFDEYADKYRDAIKSV